MKIVKDYPPNYQEIRSILPLEGDEIFTYADSIYNPGGFEISEDLQIHEAVHKAQQEVFTSPEVWWKKYLYEKDFRLKQEAEAYRVQYQFIKDHYPKKAHKEALFELTQNLRNARYGQDLSFHEAERMIK